MGKIRKILVMTSMIIPILATSACSNHCSADVNKPIWEPETPAILGDWLEKKTFTFRDFSYVPVEIKLKVQNVYVQTANVNMSYMIDILDDLPKSNSHTVYLRLLDEDGFEISRFFIGSVVPSYAGTLKGDFIVSFQKYKEIAGAEILLYKASQEHPYQ